MLKPINARPGQGLSEYGIALAVVAMASLGALQLLGGNVNQGWQGMAEGFKPAPPLKVAATGVASTLATTASSSSASLTGTLSATLSNGATISLPHYPADFAASVQVAGANGTTQLLSDSLKALADQLVASGEMDPQQANRLYALANQGHEIANAQALIEKAISQAPVNGSQLIDTPITYQGQSTTLWDLSIRLGTLGNLPHGTVEPARLLDPAFNQGDISKTFATLYQQARSDSVLMADPAVNALVTSLSQQISYSSELTEDAVSNAGVSGINDPAYVQQFQQTYATHGNAEGICSAGGGADTGVKCQ